MSATKPWFEEAAELLEKESPVMRGVDLFRLLKAALEERERLVAALALVNERYVEALRQLGEAESKGP